MGHSESIACSAGAGKFAHALEIRLLGEFSVSYLERPVAVLTWQRSHARRLIQMVCSAPKLSESRAKMLNSLWPDFDDARGRNRLHHTVHFIRKAWEEIPAQIRPQLKVTSDRVEFVPAPGTLIDAQTFVQLAEADCENDEARLSCLERGLESYRGELASGWDCPEIQARRAWLGKLFESSLRESIDIAKEVDRPAVALRHAHRLAMLLPWDCDAHCSYALLLASQARADAALVHCQEVRERFQVEDPDSVVLLDKTIQTIQRSANRPSSEGLPAFRSIDTRPPAIAGRLMVGAPCRQTIGYEECLRMGADCVKDPFGWLLSVVGPPGAGKTLFARTVAHEVQSDLRHGAAWLDAAMWTQPAQFLEALAHSLEPLCGAVVPTEAALQYQLRNKELLLIIDELPPLPSLVQLCGRLARAGRDTRWIVTGWSALQLRGERVIVLEPSQLVAQPPDGAASFAARILLSARAPNQKPDDAHAIQIVEKIASHLDGLPLSLEIAANALHHISLDELWSRLQQDPAAVLLAVPADQTSTEYSLAAAVQQWIARASDDAKRLLRLLSGIRTWVTRRDIRVLLGDGSSLLTESLVDECVRQQFLLRRARLVGSATRSEFRVPKIVTAALHLQHRQVDVPEWPEPVRCWIFQGNSSFWKDNESVAHSASDWFEDHFDDIDALATSLLETHKIKELAELCLVHVHHWPVTRYCHGILAWLVGLGELATEVQPEIAAKLMVERAKLRVHLGQFHLACDDASRALERSAINPDDEVRRQAVRIIERYGAVTSPSCGSGGLSGRGVEAGENLLRIAQLAIRHGEFTQALTICNRSAEVFNYFGLMHGLLKAHHYRAKIAFALGNTEQALRHLADVERVANHVGDDRQILRAQMMRADVLLSQMRFHEAADVASKLVASLPHGKDVDMVARAVSVIAWSYYGQGAFPVARALCVDAREQARLYGGCSLQVNVEMLSALIEARLDQPTKARRSISAALDLLHRRQPLTEPQSDIVNAAELAVYLHRCELAAPMVCLLDDFATKPNQRLRIWVSDRLRSLRAVPTDGNPVKQKSNRTPPRAVEVLSDLISR